MAEPYEDFKGYVRGGGRFVQLISRDLIRLEGACIKVAREGKKRLVRWDNQSLSLHVYSFETEEWVAIVVNKELVDGENDNFERMLDDYPEFNSIKEPRGFEDVVSVFSDTSVVNDLLIWLPLYAPMLSHDGGEGTRNETLLQITSNWQNGRLKRATDRGLTTSEDVERKNSRRLWIQRRFARGIE